MDIKIQVDKQTENFFSKLESELKQIKKCFLEIDLDNYISITFKNMDLKSKLLNAIANLLADHIIENYEKILFNRIVKSNYCYFDTEEKFQIVDIAIKLTNNEDKNFFNSLYKIRKRNIIVKELLKFFETSNILIIEGFVNFSLKGYIKDLEDIIDKAVDDFLMDREYNEFIRLLKYFVDIQESKYEVVYVVAGQDNKYSFLDENRKNITNECIQEYVNEIAEGEINYDDLLVSSLITFAPRKVVLEQKELWKNQEIVKTIENIFSNNLDNVKQKKYNNKVNKNFKIINGGLSK
jgi:putative sporulation protein YtxC